MPTMSMRQSVVIDRERYFVEKSENWSFITLLPPIGTVCRSLMYWTWLSFVSSTADSSCWHKITISELSSVFFA